MLSLPTSFDKARKRPFSFANSFVMKKENYIQNPLHDPLRPGALGLGQNLATMVVTVFNLLMYITPLVCPCLSLTSWRPISLRFF